MRGQHYFRLIYGSGRSYGLARTARERLAGSPVRRRLRRLAPVGERRSAKLADLRGLVLFSLPILSTIRRQAAEGDTLQHYKAIDAKGQRGSGRRRPNQWF